MISCGSCYPATEWQNRDYGYEQEKELHGVRLELPRQRSQSFAGTIEYSSNRSSRIVPKKSL